MRKEFARLPDGTMAYLYTLRGGGLEAHISDFGATVHRLFVPDRNGALADVVLGFDTPEEYIGSTTFFGTIIGRNSNRVKNGQFCLGGKNYRMGQNDGANNLHSGPDYFKDRKWQVEEVREDSICFFLESPDGDQGFPGNAKIRVRYTLEAPGTLRITYDAQCDQDTVFNMTNHSYFNLAGHEKPEKAMDMVLMLSSEQFTPADQASIPTGQLRSVAGTPMDFRTPKPIGKDIAADYDAIINQNGYDHNFVVCANPCAVLMDTESGRTMAVETDCPGLQFYSGNFLVGEKGKDNVHYCFRGGVCLETQYYPNALNQPQWPQPVTKAGERYHSETKYIFAAK